MLFNSHVYIFFFLPLSLLVCFLLRQRDLTGASKGWLIACSLFFYGYWNPAYLPLILASMGVNYALGAYILRHASPAGPAPAGQRAFLAGVVFNLGLLGVYKYADFFLDNLNDLTGAAIPLPHLVLPLGISFFTFTQLAYLADCRRLAVSAGGAPEYALFVTFFPHLIAGPILHHREMTPQFAANRAGVLDWNNIASGLYLFAIGLFKKVVLADSLAPTVALGFDEARSLDFVAAWTVSLAYALQLYFDFSGYTDMAIGSARMFNIDLPQNFDSPYKAVSIQDFWRRWHITLSRFLRDYLYIPLGGSRVSEIITLRNLFLTFLLGGVWHGAGWTFVAWGALHGGAMVVHRLWQRAGLTMPDWLGWLITFNFVNVAWVFFRAASFPEALKVLRGMAGLSGVVLPGPLAQPLGFLQGLGVSFGGAFDALGDKPELLVLVLALLIIALFARNSTAMVADFRPRPREAVFAAGLSVASLLFFQRASEFIYFNF